jgi:chromosome segregation ATPase
VASLEELEARVTAIEDKLRRIGEDAAAARVLAGGADRDVTAFAATLDAHRELLEALRQTQVDHGARIDHHSRKLEEHGRLLQDLEREVRAGFSEMRNEMRNGFAKLAINQSEIATLLRQIANPEPGEG